MRGHQLLDLVDDMRTRAKEEGTAAREDHGPCVVCGGEPAIIEHAPYGVGPAASYCWGDYRARRLAPAAAGGAPCTP